MRIILLKIGQTLIKERQQFPLWLPVLLAVGIGLYFALSFEPWIYLGESLGGFSLLSGCLIRAPNLRLIFLCLMTISGGFAVAQFATLNTSVDLLQKRTSFIELEATINSVFETEHGARLILHDVHPTRDHAQPTPSRIRLSVRGISLEDLNALVPGHRISVTAMLRPPPAPHLPGSYDFQRRAYFADIGAYGFAIGDIEMLGIAERGIGDRFVLFIHTLRADIAARARLIAPGPPGAVAAALLTGHRGTIPQDTLSHMRDAGIAHLLAISGLHIGLAAGTMFAFIRIIILLLPRLGQRLNAKKIASIAAILVAFCYAILAGLTVPTERAFLMTGLMLVGVLIERRGITLRSVAWAAGIILIVNPSSLIEPGFQMSFSAVICLISGYEWLSKRREPARGWLSRIWRYIAGVMMTSIIAGVATAPFAIYHFQHVAAFGLIANMIAVPLAAFWVIPAGLIALVLYPLDWDHGPMLAMSQGIALILDVAERVADIPGAALDVQSMPLWAMVSIAIGGLWLCIWRTHMRVFGVLPILLGLTIGSASPQRPDMIIDGRGRVVALQDKDGTMSISTNRRARFTVDAWRRYGGQNSTPVSWDFTGKTTDTGFRCDIHGCRYKTHDQTISISFDESALIEDCNKSDIIVALVPIRISCAGVSKKIDWFDLWRHGTHAICVRPDKTIIRSVNQIRGDRPWVVKPPPIPWPNRKSGTN
jgi:competence protein ComEC